MDVKAPLRRATVEARERAADVGGGIMVRPPCDEHPLSGSDPPRGVSGNTVARGSASSEEPAQNMVGNHIRPGTPAVGGVWAPRFVRVAPAKGRLPSSKPMAIRGDETAEAGTGPPA